MTKSGFILLFSTLMVGLGLSACLGSACGELDDLQRECCDKAPDQATKDECYKQVEAQNNNTLTPEVCEAAKAAYMCTMPTQ